MPARGLAKGMWGRKRAVAIGAIAAGALLVVVQASAGSSAADTPEFKPPQRAASIKGVGASLQEVVRTARSSGSVAAAQVARTSGVDVTASGVRVIVVPRSSAVGAAKTAVASHGGVVERTAAGLVQALVPPTALTRLAADPAVASVAPAHPSPPTSSARRCSRPAPPSGRRPDTPAPASRSGSWTSASPATPATDGAAASVTTVDFCDGKLTTANEHGTAVAEIVHEMAPAAQLYLICVHTDVELGQAEQYAKANGIKIVNHSVSW